LDANNASSHAGNLPLDMNAVPESKLSFQPYLTKLATKHTSTGAPPQDVRLVKGTLAFSRRHGPRSTRSRSAACSLLHLSGTTRIGLHITRTRAPLQDVRL